MMNKWKRNLSKKLKSFVVWLLEIGPKDLGEVWTEEDRKFFERVKIK